MLWVLPLMAAQLLITSLQTDTCNFCESKGIEYIFKNQFNSPSLHVDLQVMLNVSVPYLFQVDGMHCCPMCTNHHQLKTT